MTILRASAEAQVLRDSGKAALVIVVRDAKLARPIGFANVTVRSGTDSVSRVVQADGTLYRESAELGVVNIWVRALGYSRAFGEAERRLGFADTVSVFLPENLCGLEIDRVPR